VAPRFVAPSPIQREQSFRTPKSPLRNVATGQSAETQTDSAGRYDAPNLTPGNYEVSVSDEWFSTIVSKVTITAGAKQTLNLKSASRP
jgi:hypothetical protein